LEKLKFEHRKAVHYTLLSSIIFLQVMAIITWYNETKLSNAFDTIAASNKALKYTNLVNNSLIKSQGYFNNYINNRDEVSLKNYTTTLNEMGRLMDSLHLASSEDKDFKKILKEKDNTEAEILRIKAAIDSIIDNQISQNQDGFPKPFKFAPFESKKFLDNIKTDSYIKVDTASRKGLFSRLADAFAGRINIQKEYLNTVVTMRYKDKVSTGNVEEQMANTLLISNKYYENEFNTLKKSFSNLRKSDLKLMKLNNELLALSDKVKSNYNTNNLLQDDNQKNIEDQYHTNKMVRSYSIILLILLMLVVSVILFNFTRIAFEYEKRLTAAQEKIRQSLDFKNRITGMISHEIRSPLSIIGLYSKKAQTNVKDEELKETFKSIEFTTNSLLLLSNQILEYSKEETHQLVLKCKKVHLKDELNHILSSMSSLAETKGNQLQIESNLKSDSLVYTDVAKIHQLFYNIIGNANKFTDKGWIKVAIDFKPISGFENNLAVVISDNGVGISENDLKNIFESYYQGTVSEKVTNLGVGLGLNICKEIVELFDGEIAVTSKQGKGTQVTFNLILTQV